MRTVGVRELKARTSEILRDVRERGESVDITHRGQVIARLVPVRQSVQAMPVDREQMREFWKRWEELAAEISKDWPEGVSAQDVIDDVRREL